MSLLPEINQKTLDIKNLIASNTAFRNPYTQVFGDIDAVIVNTKNVLNLPTPPTNAAQILGAITTLEGVLNQFKTHTNALSGISLSTGLSGANAATIMQVLNTIDKYKEDGGTCQFINNVFGSIVKFAQIAGAIATLVSQITNFINNGDNMIEQRIQTLTNLLQSQITNDLLTFTEMQLRALQLSVASGLTSLLGNECLANIVSIVGTNELRTILNRKIGEATQNIL